MSHKTIKGQKVDAPDIKLAGGIPKELAEVPETFVLKRVRGDENYSLALRLLLDRFAASSYAKGGKPAEQLILESVHSLINVLTEVFPPNKEGRPLSGPEVATLFGAVLGTVAAEGYAHGRLTLEEVEVQAEVFWVALREWLARGYAGVKYMEANGSQQKRIILPGN